MTNPCLETPTSPAQIPKAYKVDCSKWAINCLIYSSPHLLVQTDIDHVHLAAPPTLRTDRQTEGHTNIDKLTERQTEAETDKDRETHIYRQRKRKTKRETETDRQKGERERDRDRQTETERQRQTDRQIDRQKQEKNRENCCHHD